jgi:hypothetical protein
MANFRDFQFAAAELICEMNGTHTAQKAAD